MVAATVALGVGPGVEIADFEDLTLAPESYWNGSDLSGDFASGAASFNNNFIDWEGGWTTWDGFGYSNITDNTVVGLAGEFNAMAGGGQGGSANYGVSADPVASGFGSELPNVTLNESSVIAGLYVTNTSYAYHSMLNGNDPPGKKFGGESGDDPDWLLLTITGKNAAGDSVGSEPFYLADFRDPDNGMDYIVDTWQYVDLSSLGVVKTLEFSLSSSDVVSYDGGVTYFVNTPAYFAIDPIVPEPVTVTLLVLGIGSLRRRARQARVQQSCTLY